jgi:hypothetical protein
MSVSRLAKEFLELYLPKCSYKLLFRFEGLNIIRGSSTKYVSLGPFTEIKHCEADTKMDVHEI